MPGTSSNYIRNKQKFRYHSLRPMFINTHTTHYDKPRYDKPRYTKTDKCLDVCCTFIVIFALLMIPVALIGNHAIKEEHRLNKEYFIHNFTISFDNQSFDNQSFDNPNYKCDLTYLDKCNHNDKPDINGIKICKFKHYMDTNTNRSQDEDGIWQHINITQNRNTLAVIMERDKYTVAVVGAIKEEMLSDVYSLQGRYFVMNGYNNSIYGNCVKNI